MKEKAEEKIERLERELAESVWEYVQLKAAYSELSDMNKELQARLDKISVKSG